MKKPLISVIIPVYNTELYLERCLKTVTENTYKNLEIICVNDGSTDHSLDILKQLAVQDSRIRVIDQPNGGVSAARNHGLDVASGAYIAFIDSDDWVHSEYFEHLQNVAQEHQADLVVCGYAQVDRYDPHAQKARLAVENSIHVQRGALTTSGNLTASPWGKLFRRSTIGSLRFPLNINFGEDQIFNIQFFAGKAEPNIRRLEQSMYFYFDRPGSLVHNNDSGRYWQIAQWYLDHIRDYHCTDIPLAHAFRALCFYRYIESFTNNKKNAFRNCRKAFRRALPWLLREKRFGVVQKIRYLVIVASHRFYRFQLVAKDPSMRTYEKMLKSQAKASVSAK